MDCSELFKCVNSNQCSHDDLVVKINIQPNTNTAINEMDKPSYEIMSRDESSLSLTIVRESLELAESHTSHSKLSF